MTRFLVSVLQGEVRDVPPLWLMRQAGRYLPEYRELRAQAHDFLDLCYSPALATEVTLQPLRRFDFDAAILFSDILVVPHALGQPLAFVQGEGPRLEPVVCHQQLDQFFSRPLERLSPVFETIRRVRSALEPEKTLIGFCGAPWTVATYMIGGGGDEQFAARSAVVADPLFVDSLVQHLADVSADYLVEQVRAGADVVQIFDSWAGALDRIGQERFCFEPLKRLLVRFRQSCPDVPVIYFPKGVGVAGLLQLHHLQEKGLGFQALGVDWSVAMEDVVAMRDASLPLQGNLDPAAVVAGGEGMERAVKRLRLAMKGQPFVFNLGHGIVPQTPIEHVEALVKAVRKPLEEM